MERPGRRRPYDTGSGTSSSVSSKRCTFRVEEPPVNEELDQEAGSSSGGEGGENQSNKFGSVKSTSFTVKEQDPSKSVESVSESFTVKAGSDAGLDPEVEWQPQHSTKHGPAEENMVPVS